jgi:hypothetical protein
MAVLDETARASIWGAYMADESGAHAALTKADIRAAVDALDVFFDTNATAINTAIPLPARTSLTLAQKSRLVRYVIQRRYG